jgi:hypothetical protein
VGLFCLPNFFSIFLRRQVTHFSIFYVLTFVKKNTLPSNFDDVLATLTRDGARVIAVATKDIDLSWLDARTVDRTAVRGGGYSLGRGVTLPS